MVKPAVESSRARRRGSGEPRRAGGPPRPSAPRRRPRPRRGDLIRGEPAGSAPVDAAGLGSRDALALPVPDQGPLELREGAHDLELEHGERVRPLGGAEDEPFLEEADVDTARRELGDEAVEVDHRPGEPVHGGDDDDVLVADVGQHRGQGRAVGAATGGVVGEPTVRLEHRERSGWRRSGARGSGRAVETRT